jgi:hypothetical protein
MFSTGIQLFVPIYKALWFVGIQVKGISADSRMRTALYFEMAIEKLQRLKYPGIDQIATELIKAEGRTIRSEIHHFDLE